MRAHWRFVLATALGLLLIAMGLAWFVLHRPGQPRELTPQRLTANPPENAVSAAAISPDGKYLAYSDPSGIHLRVVKTGETHTLPQPEGSVIQLAWFPDGTKMLVTYLARRTDPQRLGRFYPGWKPTKAS